MREGGSGDCWHKIDGIDVDEIFDEDVFQLGMESKPLYASVRELRMLDASERG